MPGFGIWAQLRSRGAILALFAGLPLIGLAGLAFGGRDGGRWFLLVLFGWMLVGVIPAAVLGRLAPAVRTRWRALPISTGEHWLRNFGALLPISLVAAELLTLGAWWLGPAPYSLPILALVCAVAMAPLVSIGLAVAAWSDSDGHMAALLTLVLLLCAIPLFPGGSPLWSEIVPTGQARVALAAFNDSMSAGIFSLIKLVMTLAVMMVAGILGARRQF